MTDPSLELQESGWEELRREARKLEGDLDVKLSSYAKLGARFMMNGVIDAVYSAELNFKGEGAQKLVWKLERKKRMWLLKIIDDLQIHSPLDFCSVFLSLHHHKPGRISDSEVRYVVQHCDIATLSGLVYLHCFENISSDIVALHGVYIGYAMVGSGYVDTGSPTVGSSRSWKSMEMEIQSLLEKHLGEYVSKNAVTTRETAIHGEYSHIDDVINQAQTTRAVLGSQRALFGGSRKSEASK
ncbi:hypothetical protein GH714_043796 [Hevea brasiliensis]|uniref:Uncharacterized protein n=1 Tax=Hevea brasiliensis TaxID=3981 RepID=A0A6A6K3N8_HEVBR|nr:hypothetical protein GH714_043796 [Hevea brasiliensis]